MHSTDGSGTPIDALLADAQILTDYYAEGEAPTAAQRIARAKARRDADNGRGSIVLHCGEDEQARRELDLASAEILNTPEAGAFLARLANNRDIEPEGALFFACLLHVTGSEDGAVFWWGFAAGSGSHRAATCLSLHHRRNAQFRDAEHWREEADRLRAEPADAGRGLSAATLSERPLLPGDVAREILAQCRRGARPHLPVEMGAVINQRVEHDDPDFGDVAQPSPVLPEVLSSHH